MKKRIISLVLVIAALIGLVTAIGITSSASSESTIYRFKAINRNYGSYAWPKLATYTDNGFVTLKDYGRFQRRYQVGYNITFDEDKATMLNLFKTACDKYEGKLAVDVSVINNSSTNFDRIDEYRYLYCGINIKCQDGNKSHSFGANELISVSPGFRTLEVDIDDYDFWLSEDFEVTSVYLSIYDYSCNAIDLDDGVEWCGETWEKGTAGIGYCEVKFSPIYIVGTSAPKAGNDLGECYTFIPNENREQITNPEDGRVLDKYPGTFVIDGKAYLQNTNDGGFKDGPLGNGADIIRIPIEQPTTTQSILLDRNFQYTILDDDTIKIDSYLGSETDVEIPSEFDGKKVTVIGENTFKNNKLLKSVIIPNGITIIERNAFYDCISLTSVTIPDSVASVSEDAFFNCSIKKILISDDSKTVTSTMIVSKEIKSVIIPYGVTSIDDCSFNNCTQLTSITIPESVTSIGKYAFSACSSLIRITIPDSVEYVESSAFRFCSSLKAVKISDSLRYIKEYVFSGCSSLVEVDIPTSVVSIDEEAFSYCTNLKKINIPANVISIGQRAFYDCPNLNSVNLSDGIMSIGDMAFGYNNMNERNVDLVIHCYLDSKAYWYAFQNRVNFDFLDPEKPFPITPIDSDRNNPATTLAPTQPETTKEAHQSTVYGDVNGDGAINLRDLIAMRKYLAKWNVAIDTAAADCNADGTVNLRDLILLRKYLAKWNIVLGLQG